MKEIKFYSRGGQGAVTAAKILVDAAIHEKKFAQAIPSYGQERKGAPVFTYARIADEIIEKKSYVYNPDIIMVFDTGLTDLGIDIYDGIKENSTMIVNSTHKDMKVDKRVSKLVVIDADHITREEMGDVPPNVAMLGAFVKATGIINIDTIEDAIKSKIIGKVGEENAKTCRRAFNETIIIENT